ncbi:MAG: hypothetical protein ACREUA_07895, partial [Burkholderiales bacterium]
MVVVNESSPGRTLELGANELRPSLWIDFDSPRRAVGIEYSYVRAMGGIDPSGVKLIAYDRAGRFIIGTDGKGCIVGRDGLPPQGSSCAPLPLPRTYVDDNEMDQRIGVRDAAGNITTVELRFDYAKADSLPPEGPGRRIIEPQVIARIWHEALPPAAVLQDLVGTELRSPGDVPGEGVFSFAPFEETYRVPLGPRSFRLPYRFDRAAAFLRGFRFEALDSSPHEVSTLEAGITQNDFMFVPGVGEEVTITPAGAVRSVLPFRVVPYFTLVAWDSEQASLSFSTSSTEPRSAHDIQQDILHGDRHSHVIFDRAGERLFAGMQRLKLKMIGGADELDDLWVVPGQQRGIGDPTIDSFSLSRIPGHGTLWSFVSRLETPDERDHSLLVDGALLAGAFGSLRLGADDTSGLPAADRHATRRVTESFAVATGFDPRAPQDDFLFDV